MYCVYARGFNGHHQCSPSERVSESEFRLLHSSKEKIIGVATSWDSSVAWTSTSIFIWGLRQRNLVIPVSISKVELSDTGNLLILDSEKSLWLKNMDDDSELMRVKTDVFDFACNPDGLIALARGSVQWLTYDPKNKNLRTAVIQEGHNFTQVAAGRNHFLFCGNGILGCFSFGSVHSECAITGFIEGWIDIEFFEGLEVLKVSCKGNLSTVICDGGSVYVFGKEISGIQLLEKDSKRVVCGNEIMAVIDEEETAWIVSELKYYRLEQNVIDISINSHQLILTYNDM